MALVAVASALSALGAGGCGGSEPDDSHSERSAIEDRTSTQHSTSQQREPSVDQPEVEAPPEGSPEAATTLPNGTVVIPPERVTEKVVPAGEGCRTATVERGQSTAKVEVPPPPGLSASLHGHSVRIQYDPGQAPRACMPYSISLLVGNEDGSRPPVSRQLRLGAFGSRTLTFPLPAYFASESYVARASTATRDGRVSPTSRVQVGK